MDFTQELIEQTFMRITVDGYLQRILTAMRGMKYPKAEGCRLSYWKRLISQIRANGLDPSWDDFQRYLKFIPSGQFPGISQDEYERLLCEADCPCEVRLLEADDLRVVILEIAFEDYVQRMSKGLKYLSESGLQRKVKGFWKWLFTLQVFSNGYANDSGLTRFVSDHNIPLALQLRTSQFAELQDRSIESWLIDFTKL